MITHKYRPWWNDLHGDVAVGVLFSVAAGLVDLLRGMAGGPPGLRSVPAVAACLGAFSSYVFVVYLVVRVGASLALPPLLPPLLPLRRLPLSIAAAFFAAGYSLTIADLGAPWNPLPALASGHALLSLSLCLLSAVGVYALIRPSKTISGWHPPRVSPRLESFFNSTWRAWRQRGHALGSARIPSRFILRRKGWSFSSRWGMFMVRAEGAGLAASWGVRTDRGACG